jgi:hypothetical protein
MGIINGKFCSSLLNSEVNPQKRHGLKLNEVFGHMDFGSTVPRDRFHRMQEWKEETYPVFGDNYIVYFSRFVFWLISNSVGFIGLNLIIIMILYNSTEEQIQDDKKGGSDAIKGVAYIYSILLALMFTNAITRYKESKRLYDALCGDIKAFAIWLSTLSQDSVKYQIDLDGFDHKATSYNPQVDKTFDKMRMLLAVLAPLAKRVVRHAHHEGVYFIDTSSAPDVRRLDDKYRIRKTTTCGCITKYEEMTKLKQFCENDDECWARKRRGINVYVKKTYATFQTDMKKANSDKKLKKLYEEYKEYDFTSWGSPGQVNSLKRELYGKVKDLNDKSGMNLFECVLYCLLDYVNEVNELEMGIDGGNERDLIMKWNHIYSSYGTLMSYNTYVQPLIIRFSIVVSLYIYTWAVTISMKENDESMLVVLGTISPYVFLWVITQLLFSPFSKRTFFLVENVSKVGRDTQREVNRLLEHRKFFDLRDMKRRKNPDIDLGDNTPTSTEGQGRATRTTRKKVIVKRKKVEEQPLLDF